MNQGRPFILAKLLKSRLRPGLACPYSHPSCYAFKTQQQAGNCIEVTGCAICSTRVFINVDSKQRIYLVVHSKSYTKSELYSTE